LTNPDIGYVTASGHGGFDALLGYGVNNIVLQNRDVTQQMARGKIFHILACNCGVSLCRKLVELGAKAAIGYNQSYGVASTGSSPIAMLTVKAATEVDRLLLGGGTAQQAVDAALAAYDRTIANYVAQGGDEFTLDWLRKNKSYLVLHADGNATL